jgi:hypothetical protein
LTTTVFWPGRHHQANGSCLGLGLAATLGQVDRTRLLFLDPGLGLGQRLCASSGFLFSQSPFQRRTFSATALAARRLPLSLLSFGLRRPGGLRSSIFLSLLLLRAIACAAASAAARSAAAALPRFLLLTLTPTLGQLFFLAPDQFCLAARFFLPTGQFSPVNRGAAESLVILLGLCGRRAIVLPSSRRTKVRFLRTST